MTLVRRTLVVLSLMFWLGGFMFYGAIVLPILRARMEGLPDPSLVTQQVTRWLNLAGTLAVLVMFVDAYAAASGKRDWLRWGAWVGMALPLPLLVWLHSVLTQRMAAPDFYRVDMANFFGWHRAYVLLNTLQWFCGVVFLAATLRSWRREDAAPIPAA